MNKKFLALLMALLLALTNATALAEATAETEESGWWNILLMGGDSRSTEGSGRTDTMIILSVNKEETQMKMTSIMRDTWVKFPGRDISHKINAANVYGGPELAVKTVNYYFGTDIEHYVLINMHDLVEMIDIVGGVDLVITESERKYANDYIKNYLNAVADYDGATYLEHSGLVHMNGLQATSFLRNRYTDSDYGRVMRQQSVLLAMGVSVQNMEINDMMAQAEVFMEGLTTNLTNDELRQLVTTGLACELEDVGQFRIPADGTFSSGMYGDVWMIRPDFKKNAKLLEDFINGDLETE